MKRGKNGSGKPAAPGGPRRRRATGRGALWLIALLFAFSGAVRLGAGSGQAIAREVAAFAETGKGAETVGPAPVCGTEADITAVLARLGEREEKLAIREDALADRLQALSVAEAQIERNLAALVEAEVTLANTMALADSAAEDDLARLTAVYESMKPKEAASLFAEMDAGFAAGFLGRMRSDAAAAILAGLEPRIAYSISVILAGRNAGVPADQGADP